MAALIRPSVTDDMHTLERALGRRIAVCGAWHPFRLDPRDWLAEPVVSYSADRAWIVAVHAREQRCGTLTRLVATIERSGRRPIICGPITHAMRCWLDRYGWTEQAGEDGRREWVSA
jgi:hypothetical protein